MTDVTVRTMQSLNDLPDFFEMMTAKGLSAFTPEFTELFDTDHRFMRAGEQQMLVFRNQDLRTLAANPLCGNMPLPAMINRGYKGDESDPIGEGDRNNVVRMLSNQLFTTNPPVHGPVRQVYVKPFGPKMMANFSPIADRIVAGLIEEFAGKGEIDFSFAFAERLTARFWGELLGMDDEEKERIAHIVRAMLPWFMSFRKRPEVRQLNEATADYYELMLEVLRRARANGNELIGAMADQFDAIDVPGKPESFELSMASNWIDGFHTGALAATGSLYYLLANPEAHAAVRDDRELVPLAAVEGLRMSAPVILTPRYALEAFDYGGVHIPQGTSILMIWAAGNRDPAAYPDPNSYQLDRAQRADTAVGGGVHMCVGRYLSRMLAVATIKGVTAPGVSIRMTGEVKWIPQSAVWQPERFPVAIEKI